MKFKNKFKAISRPTFSHTTSQQQLKNNKQNLKIQKYPTQPISADLENGWNQELAWTAGVVRN